MENNELYHHGIKGMKWGVRRANGKNKLKETTDPNRQAVESRKRDLKKRRTLSDADLKKKIERLRMEDQFKSLSNDDISPGKKFVSDVLYSSGKKTLSTLAAGAMLYGVKYAMTKEFDIKEAAGYMTPRPKNK